MTQANLMISRPVELSNPEVIQLQPHPPYELALAQLTGIQRVSIPLREQRRGRGPILADSLDELQHSDLGQ